MKTSLIFLLGTLMVSTSALAAGNTVSRKPASAESCFAQAKSRAMALLRFYSGNDDRAQVGDPVVRTPVKAPNGNMDYNVVEVPGYVYKGNYRIRLIFASDRSDSCLIMGEEILDLSRLD